MYLNPWVLRLRLQGPDGSALGAGELIWEVALPQGAANTNDTAAKQLMLPPWGSLIVPAPEDASGRAARVWALAGLSRRALPQYNSSSVLEATQVLLVAAYLVCLPGWVGAG